MNYRTSRYSGESSRGACERRPSGGPLKPDPGPALAAPRHPTGKTGSRCLNSAVYTEPVLSSWARATPVRDQAEDTPQLARRKCPGAEALTVPVRHHHVYHNL